MSVASCVLPKAVDMTQAKARKTALERLSAKLRIALCRETTNIIEIGNLLIESRKLFADEHGEWLPWLEENFDRSERSAQRYIAAAEYVAKSDTVADFSNLSPTVLYQLADDGYTEQEEAAILAATHKGRVDQTRASAICDELVPPEPEEIDQPDAADAADADDADDDSDETAEDAEIMAILDGPPPDVLPAPSPPPPNFALRKFDQAISALQRLMTKSSAQYVNSIHSSNDLENVESFIHAVADKVRKARKESGEVQTGQQGSTTAGMERRP
jgi:hypothetical protein